MILAAEFLEVRRLGPSPFAWHIDPGLVRSARFSFQFLQKPPDSFHAGIDILPAGGK